MKSIRNITYPALALFAVVWFALSPTATTNTVTHPYSNAQAEPKLDARRPPSGKRTETGTVVALTPAQITLTTSAGVWVISRTDDCTVIDAGTLALGSIVTITFCVPPGHPL